MISSLYRLRFLVGLSSLLGGCTVYVPMQGAAPAIRAKGEVEVTGSWALTNRVDASATYSPASHLLVRAATSAKGGRPNLADSNYLQNNQYELGLGTYWPLGEQWLVGGLASFGQAHSQARYIDDGGIKLFNGVQAVEHQFDAIYAKYSGEAYVSYQPSEVVSLGFSYRLVQLRLTDVTDVSVPVAAAPILRSEPMFFVRLRPALSQGVLQLQVAVGGSGAFRYQLPEVAGQDDPARQFTLSRSYVSVGLACYPHLLWRPK
jgi:hypothetical protein